MSGVVMVVGVRGMGWGVGIWMVVMGNFCRRGG